jgi:hypothetical protein
MESDCYIVFTKFRTLRENENRLKLEYNFRVLLEEKDKAMESLDYLDELEEQSFNSINKNNFLEIVSSAFNSSAPESSSSSEFSSKI